jgi:hypothetical protein
MHRQVSVAMAVVSTAVLLALGACVGQGASGPVAESPAQVSSPHQAAPASAVIQSMHLVTLSELVEQRASLRGRVVTVNGRFAGWSGRCAGPPPRNRSDWMLVDDTQCVYVTGPLPPGISAPPSTVSNGQPLSLRALVVLSDDGRVYLQGPVRP